MKKINVEKSTVFERNISSLKESLDHLEEEGFFSDFEGFTDYKEDILRSVLVAVNAGYPYEGECNGDNYKYFIPKSLAVFEEPEEKKYRPYKDFAEFANHMGLRDSNEVQFLEFRSKNCSNRYNLAYNGYEVDKFGVAYIHLGSLTFTFDELFNNYEYELNSFELVPFGVLENES